MGGARGKIQCEAGERKILSCDQVGIVIFLVTLVYIPINSHGLFETVTSISPDGKCNVKLKNS